HAASSIALAMGSGLRSIFSNLKVANILAGHYFKVSCMCFLWIMAFRIAELMQFLKYDYDLE
ncbi:hypothetical protein, partial [Serratia marcescens]|uniref:hypothetical protein n=1 Tax=Serratia marcescens TaxID=615 RepID=UPI001954DE35